MKVVSFANIGSIPLDDLPNIKTIRLTDVDVVWGPDDDMPVSSSLEVLSVFDCEREGLSKIFYWARTRQLRSLEFRTKYSSDLSGLMFGFHPCFEFLTRLDLDFQCHCMFNSSVSPTFADL